MINGNLQQLEALSLYFPHDGEERWHRVLLCAMRLLHLLLFRNGRYWQGIFITPHIPTPVSHASHSMNSTLSVGPASLLSLTQLCAFKDPVQVWEPIQSLELSFKNFSPNLEIISFLLLGSWDALFWKIIRSWNCLFKKGEEESSKGPVRVWKGPSLVLSEIIPYFTNVAIPLTVIVIVVWHHSHPAVITKALD